MSEQQNGSSGEEQRVAAALAQIQASVRQRTAELSTLGDRDEHRNLRLVDLRQSEFLQEPFPVSPRPVIGRLIVWIRKAMFQLFQKWHSRPLLIQQNRYNRAVRAMIEDLLRDQKQLDSELRDLRRLLAEREPPNASSQD